jgi:hypothetical protein
MSDLYTDDDMECGDGEIENDGENLFVTHAHSNKTFRRRIEEYEESKWLRAALDDI